MSSTAGIDLRTHGNTDEQTDVEVNTIIYLLKKILKWTKFNDFEFQSTYFSYHYFMYNKNVATEKSFPREIQIASKKIHVRVSRIMMLLGTSQCTQRILNKIEKIFNEAFTYFIGSEYICMKC